MLACDLFEGAPSAPLDDAADGFRGDFDAVLASVTGDRQHVDRALATLAEVVAEARGATEAEGFVALLGQLAAVVEDVRRAQGSRVAAAVVPRVAPLLFPLGEADTGRGEALLASAIRAAAQPQRLAALLDALGLAEQPVLAAACRQYFLDEVEAALDECRDTIDESTLDDVLAACRKISATLEAVDPAHSRHATEEAVYTEFGRMRIDMIFDMLVDYPGSEPAIDDLRRCLIEVPGLYTDLVTVAREQIGRRLLHVGAKTEDIIQVYIDTMKVVDLLFPGQHRAVDAITNPIQRYVRNRKDGAALFVLGLIGDPSSQLAELLHPELQVRRGELCDVEEEGMTACQKHTRRLDILKRLVHTFGNQENVLMLYRSVLAEKLMAIDDFDADAELTALELLKVRFGETPLHTCEVMVKDIADSKRFTTAAQTSNPSLAPHTTLIQSNLYWPPIPTQSNFTAHPIIRDIQTAYAKEYAQQKEPRRLIWQDGVGNVRLTITLFTNAAKTEREKFPINAGVVPATLLLHLVDAQSSEAGGLTAAELAELTGLDVAAVAGKMAMWLQKALVVYTPDACAARGFYKCAERKTQPGIVAAEEEEIGATDIMAAEEEEANERIGDFVGGILTNFGAQDVAFIENKLRQFMPDYGRTTAQLEALLGTLVAAGDLVLQGNVYQTK